MLQQPLRLLGALFGEATQPYLKLNSWILAVHRRNAVSVKPPQALDGTVDEAEETPNKVVQEISTYRAYFS